MTFEEMQTILASVVASQAKTEAIANSNARAIEAVANQQSNVQSNLIELAQIVQQIGESSNRRLTALEDRQ
jgi:hypothetical protein